MKVAYVYVCIILITGRGTVHLMLVKYNACEHIGVKEMVNTT